jgi:hypothetical protein
MGTWIVDVRALFSSSSPPLLLQVQDGSVEARRVAQLTKKGEEKVIDTLRLLKEGCRAGWPWGKESFDGSAAAIAEARAHFGQAGLTGFEPESGRMQVRLSDQFTPGANNGLASAR